MKSSTSYAERHQVARRAVVQLSGLRRRCIVPPGPRQGAGPENVTSSAEEPLPANQTARFKPRQTQLVDTDRLEDMRVLFITAVLAQAALIPGTACSSGNGREAGALSSGIEGMLARARPSPNGLLQEAYGSIGLQEVRILSAWY
jgi:hypothetical protein